MTESFIQGPVDSTGKKVRTSQQAIGANTVETEYVRIEPQGGPDAVQFIGTATNRATNEWVSLQSMAVPAGFFAAPLAFRALSATAAYGARAIYLRKLGSYNLSTNVYTDTGATAVAGSFFAGLTAVPTSVISAATNINATYTDNLGASHTTANLALAASQPIASRLDFVLATRSDVFGGGLRPDTGVRDVTGITESPGTAATGVVDIYGYDIIAYQRCVAANTVYSESFDPHLWALPAGDIISVESNSYGTAVAAIVQERVLTLQLTAY